MDSVLFIKGIAEEVIESIIYNKRQKHNQNTDRAITDQERCDVINDALKVYQLIQEKSEKAPKVLIEYRNGVVKETEEIDINL